MRRKRPQRDRSQNSGDAKTPALSMLRGFSRGVPHEDRALAWLEDQGLRLIKRNFRARTGEIDLIMRSGEMIVFVEVRQRSHRRSSLQLLDERKGRHFGSAAATITPAKIQRIRQTAEIFLQQSVKRSASAPICRFDVIAIDGEGSDATLNWIKRAF